MLPSPQAQKGVDKRGKPIQGLKDGKLSELNMFYRVKPGHEEAIRKAIYNFHNPAGVDPALREDGYVRQGVSELRQVLFDNDTRLLWMTSFDTEWDPYIDDTVFLTGETAADIIFGKKAHTSEEVAIAGVMVYGQILQHTEEAPEGIGQGSLGKLPNPGDAVKDLFNATRVNAAGFLVTQPDVTLIEHRKNRGLRKAFDAVLKHPDAKQALQHPALKPLRDIAGAVRERKAA